MKLFFLFILFFGIWNENLADSSGGQSERPAEAACGRYTDEHGVVSSIRRKRVINGSPAGNAEFPWMAALGLAAPLGFQGVGVSFCGATIISPRFILTAANCVYKMEPELRKHFVIRFGDANLVNSSGVTSQQVQYYAKEIFTHPNYNDSTKKHDVALVELTEDIKWTANIKPACLNTDTHDLGPEVKLTLTGWGIKDPWKKVESNALLKTTLITTPLSRCNETYSTSSLPEEEARLAVLIDGQYCAIDPTVLEEGEMAAGPCRDNGAPLQFIPDNSRIARIVGISSYGIACGNHLPAVFTRVAYYLNWIESIVWPESRPKSN